MIGYLQRGIIRHLVSPYGIAAIPCCLFLIAWLFPPGLYTRYIFEPDLMHHNVMLLVFFALCVAAFLLGVRMTGHQSTPHGASPKIRIRSDTALLYLVLPLLMAAGPCLIYLLLIARSVDIVALLASQRGDVIKQSLAAGGPSGAWDFGLFILTGVLWWATYRAGQLSLKGIRQRIFAFIYLCCFTLDVVTCLTTFDRTNLMPLLAGVTLIYLFFKTRDTNVSLSRLALTGFGAIASVLGSFIALQYARSASQIDSMTASVLGYSIVSYNRLAALLMGALHYLYQGKGAYGIAFLTQNTRFHLLREQMGLPSFYEVWLTEFPALSASGLNAAYNWASVFGYVFADIGWWTPVYTFTAGLLGGYLWSCFRAGATLGIVFYPWLAFWILFWSGWNLLFDSRAEVLFVTCILLIVYDKLFLLTARKVLARPPVIGSAQGSAWPSAWGPRKRVVPIRREELT